MALQQLLQLGPRGGGDKGVQEGAARRLALRPQALKLQEGAGGEGRAEVGGPVAARWLGRGAGGCRCVGTTRRLGLLGVSVPLLLLLMLLLLSLAPAAALLGPVLCACLLSGRPAGRDSGLLGRLLP